jgi:peptidoglycan hydrolase FlgJ
VTLPLSQIGSPSTGAADTSRIKNQGNLDKAGAQFEAVFTRMMLGAMRKTKLADSLFESKALDTFRDMQDGQVADAMATHAPIGIGRAVTEFLGQKGMAPQSDLNDSGGTAPQS